MARKLVTNFSNFTHENILNLRNTDPFFAFIAISQVIKFKNVEVREN